MSNNSKKIIVALSVLAFLILSGQVFATSEGWKKVAENINKDQDQSLVDVAEMEKYLKMDETALKKELANLKAEDKKESNLLKSLENKYNALRKEETQHEKDLADEQSEIQAIEDNVRNIVKDAISVSRDNPITAEYPERKTPQGSGRPWQRASHRHGTGCQTGQGGRGFCIGLL